MDIFALDPTTYTNGKIINGLDSITWVERFLDDGEVTIIADPTPEILSTLAVGNLISHVDTLEVMVIESHLIEESDSKDKVKIVGTSADSYAMQNRTVSFPTQPSVGAFAWISQVPFEYSLLYDYPWFQAVKLIEDFLKDSLFDPVENLPNFDVYTTIADPGTPDGVDGRQSVRKVKKMQILKQAVAELLAPYGAGVKVERPSSAHDTLDFIIHGGQDRTGTVRFEYNSQDLAGARYLWSIKGTSNGAWISSKYYGTHIYPPGVSGWGLRMLPVDMSDWDVDLDDDKPGRTSDENSDIYERLTTSGNDALGQVKYGPLLDSSISDLSVYRYGVDYKIGDLVYVLGDYGVSAIMRVVEYAQTLDDTGLTGFPTLEWMADAT